MKMRNVLFIFAIALMLIGYASYSFVDLENKDLKSEEIKNQDIVTKIEVDSDISNDINSIIDKTELVVLGEYVSYYDTINLSRNPDNPNEEDTNLNSSGKRYIFKIDSVLKGEVDSEKIMVVLEKTTGLMDNDRPIEIDNEYFVEPSSDAKLILFLKPSDLDDLEPTQYPQYYPPTNPNSFISKGISNLNLESKKLNESASNIKFVVNTENKSLLNSFQDSEVTLDKVINMIK